MTAGTNRTLAVTGGTGFVGEHLLRMAIAAEYQVRALTRGKRPAVGGIHWIDGSLDRPDSLSALCEGADIVIHVAGLITGSRAAFDAVNIKGTASLIETASGHGIRRFVHISSLAAREPDLSSYGWSKAESETLVTASDLEWTIIRPPAIYGPGDREMLELFKMAKRGMVPLPPKGRFSLIHVEDLCRLILASLEAPETIGSIYEPDDARENGWDHRHFARTLGRLFGRRAVTVTMPKLLMHCASRLDRLFRRKRAKLTADRVNYFCHPDWVITADRRPPPELWRPEIHSPTGLKQTADWYRQHEWL